MMMYVMQWMKGGCWRAAISTALAGLFAVTLVATGEAAPKKAKNPCAANPCAANPCAAGNPCNPCAGRSMVAGPSAKAVMLLGEVASKPSANRLTIKADGKRFTLEVDRMTLFREGANVKSFKDLKPGDEVTVSALDKGGKLRALYVYKRVRKAGGNPCNPCAANPCAAKNPCAPKNPCAANPCSPKR